MIIAALAMSRSFLLHCFQIFYLWSRGIVVALSAAHESCDVLSLLLAGPPLLVRVDHAHADAHEVCVFDAPL